MTLGTEAFHPGHDLPGFVQGATDTVLGGRACEFVPGTQKRRVKLSTGAARFAGVARQDVTAPGAGLTTKVGLMRNKPVYVVASGTVQAGDPIAAVSGGAFASVAAAGGTYVQGEANATRTIAGQALQDAANGATFEAFIY